MTALAGMTSPIHHSLLAADALALQQQVVPLSDCETEQSRQQHIRWQVLRLDQLPAHINGNKGFKLLPALEQAAANGQQQIISFGGAHSNHLYALAHAAKRYGFTAIGIVRAYAAQPLTETLKDCQLLGMQLHFADKSEYAQRHQPSYWHSLQAQYGASSIISEGGADEPGIRGASLIAEQIAQHSRSVDYISIASGTGTSLQGLLQGAAKKSLKAQVLGFLALNNRSEIDAKLQQLDEPCLAKLSLHEQFHCGGFAKINTELARFMAGFEQQQGIMLEPVYTAKMFYGMSQLMQQGYFAKGSHIISIHTGGLQGRRALAAKIGSLANQAAAKQQPTDDYSIELEQTRGRL